MPVNATGTWYPGRSSPLGRFLCWLGRHSRKYSGHWDGAIVCVRCGKDLDE